MRLGTCIPIFERKLNSWILYKGRRGRERDTWNSHSNYRFPQISISISLSTNSAAIFSIVLQQKIFERHTEKGRALHLVLSPSFLFSLLLLLFFVHLGIFFTSGAQSCPCYSVRFLFFRHRSIVSLFWRAGELEMANNGANLSLLSLTGSAPHNFYYLFFFACFERDG